MKRVGKTFLSWATVAAAACATVPAEAATTTPPPGLKGLDWAIIAAYVAVLLVIGFAYARRQKTTEEYFVASRSVSPFMAGISLCATMLSTVSYIAVPGEVIQNGPVVACLYMAALPITYLIAGWLIIPAIMKLRITSAYELLEARLGRGVRLLGSAIFITTRTVWMALILYTMGNILVALMGWDEDARLWIAVACGLITTIYTVAGGIAAVVLTDVIQFFVLLAGALVALVTVSSAMGGPAAWWPDQWYAHWATQPVVSFDPHVRVTMLGTLVGTVIWWVCTSGSDQMAIQRYLTTPDTRSARRAFLLNNVADTAVTVLLGLVGLALIAYYQARPEELPTGVTPGTQGDSLFLTYLSRSLPAGILGLVVSGLMAAAMSSLSSGINGIISVFTKDFVEVLWPSTVATERAKMRLAYILSILLGIVAIAGSLVMGNVRGNLLEVAFKTTNLFVCPLFGLFFLAIFIRRATAFGAVMGAFYSFSAAFIVGYWDVLTGLEPISFQWIAPVSFVVSIVASIGFSLLPQPQAKRGQVVRQLGAWAPFAAGFWALLQLSQS